MTTRHTASSSAAAASGTFALVVDPDDNVLAQRGLRVPDGLPNMAAVAAARASGRDIRTTSLLAQGFGPGGSPSSIQTPVRS